MPPSNDGRLAAFATARPIPIHLVNGLLLPRSRWCVVYEMMLLEESVSKEFGPEIEVLKRSQKVVVESRCLD